MSGPLNSKGVQGPSGQLALPQAQVRSLGPRAVELQARWNVPPRASPTIRTLWGPRRVTTGCIQRLLDLSFPVSPTGVGIGTGSGEWSEVRCSFLWLLSHQGWHLPSGCPLLQPLPRSGELLPSCPLAWRWQHLPGWPALRPCTIPRGFPFALPQLCKYPLN